MYLLEEVQELEGKSNTALVEMQQLVDSLAAKIDTLKSDGSRSESYKAESIQKERDMAMPAIREQSEIINAVNKELHPQSRFWESKPLILAQQKFSAVEYQDAMIRSSVGRELAAVPLAVLTLHTDSAIADKNLPMFYQCWLAANSRSANSRSDENLKIAALEVNLDLVDIPEQLQALAAISQAFVNVKTAEFCMIDAVGARVSPYNRLNAINSRDNAARHAEANRTAAAAITSSKAGL